MAIIFQRSSEVMFIDEVCDLEDIEDFLATFFAVVCLGLAVVFLVTFFAGAFLMLTAVFLAAFFLAGLLAVLFFLLSVVMILSCRLIIDALV